MDNVIKLVNNENKIVDCNILIRFEYKGDKYIVYTDNILNELGNYTMYKALIDKDNNIVDPSDNSVDAIFERLIYEYKKKVIKGEI